MGPEPPDDARLRACANRERVDEISRQMVKLQRGTRNVAEDLERAQLAAYEALRASSEAHTRAAAALRRTAKTHRVAAKTAQRDGDQAKAEAHLYAADTADRAARVHDRAAEANWPIPEA